MDNVFVFFTHGLSYGGLLFLVSAGLALVFGMMNVLNFAHADFHGRNGGLTSHPGLKSFLGAHGLMQILSLTTSSEKSVAGAGQGRRRQGETREVEK